MTYYSFLAPCLKVSLFSFLLFPLDVRGMKRNFLTLFGFLMDFGVVWYGVTSDNSNPIRGTINSNKSSHVWQDRGYGCRGRLQKYVITIGLRQCKK